MHRACQNNVRWDGCRKINLTSSASGDSRRPVPQNATLDRVPESCRLPRGTALASTAPRKTPWPSPISVSIRKVSRFGPVRARQPPYEDRNPSLAVMRIARVRRGAAFPGGRTAGQPGSWPQRVGTDRARNRSGWASGSTPQFGRRSSALRSRFADPGDDPAGPRHQGHGPSLRKCGRRLAGVPHGRTRPGLLHPARLRPTQTSPASRRTMPTGFAFVKTIGRCHHPAGWLAECHQPRLSPCAVAVVPPLPPSAAPLVTGGCGP